MRLRMDAVYGHIDHLSAVMDSPALRAAVQVTNPIRTAFELRVGQSKAIYDALDALSNTAGLRSQLNDAQLRLLSSTLRDYRNNGVGLTQPQRARFNKIINKLQQLSTNYTNNILDSTKTAYTAYRSLASAGKSDNTPIIRQILGHRRGLSGLLGYPNYAEQSLSSKMATFEDANDLLLKVAKDARPAAEREEAQVTAFARKATGNRSLQLQWWDKSFWAERQREALFKVRQEELREHLPLDSVVQGLFKLAKRLYGIDIKPAQQGLSVWHPDVKVFAVSDTGASQPIAYFYADLYARPGQKQGGAWVQPFWDRASYVRMASPAALQAQKQAALYPAVAAASSDKTTPGNKSVRAVQWSPSLAQQTHAWLRAAPLQVPLALLVTNQDPPADGKPSLMSLSDAETLFHEFGHVLQHLLTRSQYGLTSGMRSIEWDAVEFPSQMQEKWVYDNQTFNGFARHYKTGKPVPADMFAKIKGSQTYRQGNSFAYQITLARADLLLHSSFDPKGKTSPMDVLHTQFSSMMPYKVWPGDRTLANFGHIFSGGYAAGYYSYMWADVMSTDAFMAFVEVGTGSEAAVQKLGRRFRASVLSSGGQLSPGAVFKEFRGRGPQVEPLLKYNALESRLPNVAMVSMF
ncbi:oligopeptidase A [Scenedesmus sp. NREL 46B-D3]|nr:oligopeptidase A [Scenedesmus sp. NREL 46B-D3]